MIEQGLVSLLKTFSEVTDLVGSGDAARIRPERLEQDDRTMPAITIEVLNEQFFNDLTYRNGLVNSTIRITSLSENQVECRTLAEAIRTNGTNPGTGLAGYSGSAGSYTIDASELVSRNVVFTPRDDGDDGGYFECESTYEIWHQETP